MSRRLPRLEQWFFPASDPYLAPELHIPRVAGNVFGHPDRKRHPDGKQITTSGVKRFARGVVETVSGSRYRLGEPLPAYLAHMQAHHPGWDPSDPMRVPGREQP